MIEIGKPLIVHLEYFVFSYGKLNTDSIEGKYSFLMGFFKFKGHKLCMGGSGQLYKAA